MKTERLREGFMPWSGLALGTTGPVLRAAGAALALRAADPYHWAALAAPARINVAAVYATHLGGAARPAPRTVLVLARSAGDVTPGDRAALRGVLDRGGTVMAGRAIARALAARPV